jgi:hypothetical protein
MNVFVVRLPRAGQTALSQIFFETSLEVSTGLSGAVRVRLRG